MRIGIYGGTFSPVHNGHIESAKAFMKQMWLDLLYVIPCAEPPHKRMDDSATAQQRLDMCDLAFFGIDGVVVSDMEIRRGGKSYTVETLRELSSPENRLFLLCGTDMLLTLDTWYCADEIFELCYPVYVRREKDCLLDGRIVSKIAEYNDKYGKVARRIVTEPIEISSSEIRKKIQEGEDVSNFIPISVAEYIERAGLYR